MSEMPDAMDSTDTQMTEPESSTVNTGLNDAVAELLALARQFINQGKPSQALQAVVIAMRTEGGDAAVFQALHRAREQYRNKIQANAAADQLASLFAECAIAEAQPAKADQSADSALSMNTEPSVATDSHQGISILEETGRQQIMLDAFQDGQSYICLQCGGIVSSQRKEEHDMFWCCQI